MTALPGQNDLAYGEGINHNLLNFIGPMRGTIVDLGCGTGGWADHLRMAGARSIKGLEPTSGASVASERYDEVLQCPIESAPESFFADASLVILADVLEHLVDPWDVLFKIRRVVQPGTRLAISLPNLQNFRILLPILRTGDFRYTDLGGVLDRGHLRWFTQTTLIEAVEAAGWSVERSGGYELGRVSKMAMRVTRGRAGPLIFHQLHLLCRA